MIEANLDTAKSILHVRPKEALEQVDFEKLAATVDPYLETSGELRGLIIEVPTFPGWENLGAMIAHIRFIRDHHKRIEKLAVVTNSTLGELAEHLASHFVAAEIKRFPAGEITSARQWITNEPDG